MSDRARTGRAIFRMPTPAAWCAVVAVLSGLAAALATHGGAVHPAQLINLADTDPLAGLVRAGDPRFPLVTSAQHYDGVYYYAIARDPLLLGHAHQLIDQAAYRYGHPLNGWLAAVLAVGHPGAIPAALFLLNLLGLGTAGWLVARLAEAHGATPWLGLLIATSPGLLYATTVSTTEPVGAALVVGGLVAWMRDRTALAVVVMAAAALDKEQYLVVPVGLAVTELLRSARRRPGRTRGPLALVVTPLPLALWYLYVHAQLHRWPFGYEPGNLGRPGAGWARTFAYAHDLAGGGFEQSQIGTVTPPVLVALAALLVAATIKAVRWADASPLHLPFALLAVITACQGWRTLLYPHELVRTPAIAVLLAVLVLVLPLARRRPTRPPVRPTAASAEASPPGT